jgi:hypothetical protein
LIDGSVSLLRDSIHSVSSSARRSSTYMQNMKKQTCLSVACCAGINLLFILIGIVQPANAIDGDVPIPSDFVPGTDDPLIIQQIETGKKVQTFSWSLWSNPYLEGNKICRQYHGNMVCFLLGTSKQLNWQPQPFSYSLNQPSSFRSY